MPPAGVMRLETHSVKLLHTKPQRFDRIHLSSDVIHRYLGHGPKGLQTPDGTTLGSNTRFELVVLVQLPSGAQFVGFGPFSSQFPG